MNPIYSSPTRSLLPLQRGSLRARYQAGVAKPVVVAVLVVLAAGAGWWYWSSHSGQPGGTGAAASDPAHAGSAPSAEGRKGGGSGGGGGRFGGAGKQPVSVVAVRKQDVRVTVNAIGSIVAANTAVVHAKVSGELKAIYFKEGQTVAAGALLALIDPAPYQIAVAQAQGTLQRDQALLANAKIDLTRYRDLFAKDAGPKQQLDTQQSLVAQLEGTVLSDQAQVDNAKLQLSYTKVTAPIAGLVGLKQVDLGNVVQPSDTNGLLSIAQTRPVNVVFAVPDVQLPQILRQMKAANSMPVEAWDRDQKNKLADGKLASTDNAIDNTTGTIKLKAQFANAKDELFPNQFVNVRLQVDSIENTLAVPSAAVLLGPQGSYVYVVNAADSTVSVHRVRPGAADGDWVSVQGDVKAGDMVVTDGTDRLREGAAVTVIAPNAGGKGGADGTGGSRHRRDAASAVAGAASAQASAPASTPRTEAGSKPEQSPQAGASAAAGAEDPPWLSRLPADVADKVRAMTPEQRAEWIKKRREERAKNADNN